MQCALSFLCEKCSEQLINKFQKQIAVQLNDKPLPAIQTVGRIKYFKLQQIKVNMPKTVWIDQQGNRYEGQLNIPQKSGHGIVSFTNGGKFEGHWINYKREGYGVQYSSHGEIYSGEWVNDKKDMLRKVTHKARISSMKFKNMPNNIGKRASKQQQVWPKKSDD